MMVNKIKMGFHQPKKVLYIFTSTIYIIINIIGGSLSKAKKVPFFVLRKIYARLPANLKARLINYHLVKLLISKAITSARFFIKPGVERTDFFLTLNDRDISYTLLRWWENFPEIPNDEDMDILVNDQDRNKIEDMLVRYPNKNKCDIYTVTGIGSGDYHKLPYFSNKLSRDLLSNRVMHNNLVYVPTKKMHFASLAYHALFHKGADSGVPGFGYSYTKPDHNYKEILCRLNNELDLGLEITAENLFEWLKQEGYAPPEDLLAKLTAIKPELNIFAEPVPHNATGGEFMAFVIREKAIEENLLDDILDILTVKFKLEILETVELSGPDQEEFSITFRGGKWDKGPYSESGGQPKVIVFCFDYYPGLPGLKEKAQFPAVTNSNIVKIKNDCRNLVFNTRLWYKHFNAMHTADNESEALLYLKKAASNSYDLLVQKIDYRRKTLSTPFPVHKILSEGRRSRVELIDFNGIPAVKKTFRPGCERYCNREIYATDILSKKYDFIPKLLSRGENYLITQYIENPVIISNFKFKNLIKKKYKENIFRVIQCMYKERYELINFIPENIIIDKNGAFYVIDYEFLQPMDENITDINDTIMVKGVREDYCGDLPRGFYWYNSSFNSIWKAYTGSWEELTNRIKNSGHNE